MSQNPDEDERGIVRVTLRMPRELHDRLQERARRDRRSLHAELLHLVERALGEET